MVLLNDNWFLYKSGWDGVFRLAFPLEHPFSPFIIWVDSGEGYYEPL